MRSDQQNFRCECDPRVKSNLLQGSGWLPKVESRTRDKLARVTDVYVFPAGTQIMREGELDSSVSIVVSGTVEITRRNSFGEVVVIGEVAQGQCFGELSLVDRGPRTADAHAATNVTILTISSTTFFRLCRKSPEVALPVILKVSKLICYRLRETDHLLANIDNSRTDPIEFLIALHQRLGAVDSN